MIIFGILFLELRNKSSYLGAFSLITAISVPALYYIPTNSDDLYRYFLEMNVVRPYRTISELFSAYHDDTFLLIHGSNQKSNYIYNIFQWLISRSGNYALLPFLSVLIIYFCVVIPFVHQDIVRDKNISRFLLGSIVVLAIFPYMASISTVRWNIASAIFFLLVYISFNCHFNRLYTLPLYIIPLLIHEGMVLPISIVIICLLLKNIHIRWYVYILFTIFLFIVFFVTSHGTSNASQNFRYYNSSSISVFFGGSRFSALFGLLASVVPYIYLLLSLWILKDNKNIHYDLEFKMLILFVITDISLFFDLTLANRYALNVGLCSLLIYLRTEKNHGKVKPEIKYIFLITSVFYIFLMIVFIILKSHFNLSQINFSGVYDVTKLNPSNP